MTRCVFKEAVRVEQKEIIVGEFVFIAPFPPHGNAPSIWPEWHWVDEYLVNYVTGKCFPWALLN